MDRSLRVSDMKIINENILESLTEKEANAVREIRELLNNPLPASEVNFDAEKWGKKSPKQKKSFARTKVTDVLKRDLKLSIDDAGEKADDLIDKKLDLVRLMNDLDYLTKQLADLDLGEKEEELKESEKN